MAGLLERAAGGDRAAQHALALRYRDGKGVARNMTEALRWGHRAADQGHAEAMDFIGFLYFRGVEVPRNPDLAAGYFKAAAGQSAQAAWNLGQCYFAAQGVPQDIPKALELWEQAAARGHGRAAAVAAMTLLAGDGVPPDPVRARQLAERAVALHDPSGYVVLGELHFQAGEHEQARALWTQAAGLNPTRATGNPEQPSGELASQQGADLLALMEYRTRRPAPGTFNILPVPHLLQGWNNCGATSCAMLARALGKRIGSWDYKKLCPSPPGTGTDWGDLVAASRQLGLAGRLVTFTPDDEGFAQATAFARGEVDAGRPVVIDFKYLGPQYPNGEAGHTLLLAGYLADQDLYVLCNPAIATPGLQLISAADLKRYWRSDHYGRISSNVLSRPALVGVRP